MAWPRPLAVPVAGILPPEPTLTMNPNDAIHAAQESGLSLPSPAWIFGCILFSLIGFAAWRYGKTAQNPRVRWLGVALMVYGYVAGPTWLLWGIGIALCGAIWWYGRS